jgi:hypothetical protein
MSQQATSRGEASFQPFKKRLHVAVLSLLVRAFGALVLSTPALHANKDTVSMRAWACQMTASPDKDCPKMVSLIPNLVFYQY